MSVLMNRWMDSYIFALDEDNYLYLVIKKHYERQVFLMFEVIIANIVNEIGKIYEYLALIQKIIPYMYPRTKTNSSNISKVRCFMEKKIIQIKLLFLNR